MGKRKTMQKQTDVNGQYLGKTVFGIVAPLRPCDIKKLKMLQKDSDSDLVEMKKRNWKEHVQKLPIGE